MHFRLTCREDLWMALSYVSAHLRLHGFTASPLELRHSLKESEMAGFPGMLLVTVLHDDDGAVTGCRLSYYADCRSRISGDGVSEVAEALMAAYPGMSFGAGTRFGRPCINAYACGRLAVQSVAECATEEDRDMLLRALRRLQSE